MSKSFGEYVLSLINTMLFKQESDFDIKCNPLNTILINTRSVGTLDFDASEDDKEALCEAGREAVRDYLESQSKVLLKTKMINDHGETAHVANYASFFNSTCRCGKFDTCPPSKEDIDSVSRLT